MDQKSCKAWILNNYGEKMEFKECPIGELEEGDVLIKVEASTINPSDREFLTGNYMKLPLPTRPGFEGVGRVIQGKGENA